jgi:hypothetical protein
MSAHMEVVRITRQREEMVRFGFADGATEAALRGRDRLARIGRVSSIIVPQLGQSWRSSGTLVLHSGQRIQPRAGLQNAYLAMVAQGQLVRLGLDG